MKINFKKSVKGKKFYGIMRKEMNHEPICIYDSLEKAKSALDSTFTIIVEMEITRAFTRNPEIIEIIL